MQRIASCLEVLDGFLRHPFPVVSSFVVEQKLAEIDRPGTMVDCVTRILGMLQILPYVTEVNGNGTGVISNTGTVC